MNGQGVIKVISEKIYSIVYGRFYVLSAVKWIIN